jgi:type IV secretion system protein VirB5
MRTLLCSAAMVGLLVASAHAQVPVTDTASLVQEVKSYVQDIKGYALQGQQYLTQAQQLSQQVQTYYAFVQNPSLGAAMGVMGQTGLGNSLPINPSGLIGLTSGYSMSLSGLSGKLAQLSSLSNASYDQNHIYTCTDQSWSCTQQKQRGYGLAGTSGLAQSAYQNLRDHMPVVQALRDRAETATTPAEREQVSMALQSEQSWHDNLMGQVEAAKMQADTDTQNLVQQDHERLTRDIDATIAAIPGD